MKIPLTLKIAGLLCAALLPVVSGSAQPVTKVASGGGFTLLLKSDGSLWGMGDNRYRQLRDSTEFEIHWPVEIVASNVTAIATGYSHSLFLKKDGSLWAMGYNTEGQLGDGTTNNICSPAQIVASNVTAIAAGRQFSLFLKSDGSLWSMGENYDGELGDGTHRDSHRPEKIVAGDVVAIAAGYYHSLFIKRDGSLWAMGGNWYGPLGDGTTNNCPRPERIVAGDVTTIASGGDHSLFLKSNGSLWVMGDNGGSQYSGAAGDLGDGTTNNACLPEQIVASNVTAIAAGQSHSLFLKSDGSLWGMGDNLSGQLGSGGALRRAVVKPKRMVADGVIAMAAGNDNSFFLKSDGNLWATGDNLAGQFGDGTNGIVNLPENLSGK